MDVDVGVGVGVDVDVALVLDAVVFVHVCLFTCSTRISAAAVFVAVYSSGFKRVVFPCQARASLGQITQVFIRGIQGYVRT